MDEIQILQLINSKYTNEKLCKEKHKGVERLHQRVDNMDKKLWGVLVMQILILGGLIGTLIKAVV